MQLYFDIYLATLFNPSSKRIQIKFIVKNSMFDFYSSIMAINVFVGSPLYYKPLKTSAFGALNNSIFLNFVPSSVCVFLCSANEEIVTR